MISTNVLLIATALLNVFSIWYSLRKVTNVNIVALLCQVVIVFIMGVLINL